MTRGFCGLSPFEGFLLDQCTLRGVVVPLSALLLPHDLSRLCSNRRLDVIRVYIVKPKVIPTTGWDKISFTNTAVIQLQFRLSTYSVGFVSSTTGFFFFLALCSPLDIPLSFFLFGASDCLVSETQGTFELIWGSFGPTLAGTVLSFAFFSLLTCPGLAVFFEEGFEEFSFAPFFSRVPFWCFGGSGFFFSAWLTLRICGV